jgi:hypothetical protein
MVLPAANACDVNADESASAPASAADFQRERWNILRSPDVKLVKGGLFVMHAARYLGALTRCNFKIFETCTKRAARQSGIWLMAAPRSRCAVSRIFHFTNTSPVTLVSGTRCISAIKSRL